MFDIAVSEHQEFWEYLKGKKKKDHLLLELWFQLNATSSYRPQMTRRELIFQKPWVNDVVNGSSVRTKISAISNFLQKFNVSEDAPFDMSDSARAELNRILDVGLQELYDGWDPEASRVSAEDKARVVAEAKKRLEPTRRKAQETVRNAAEGLLWHTNTALDGQPLTVVTASLTARPPQALVKLGQAPEGAPPGDRKTLSARWRWYEDQLFVEVIDGERRLHTELAASLGVRSVKLAALTATPAGGNKKIFDHLYRLSNIHVLGSKGWFWYVEDLPERGAVVLVRPSREAEMPKQLAGLTFFSGEWTRELLKRRVTFRLEAPATARDAAAVAAILRKRLVYKALRVEVTGVGFHDRDPRFPVKVRSLDPTSATRLTRLHEANKKLAKEPSGRFWFAEAGLDDKPVVVLYKEATPLFDKNALVPRDRRVRSTGGIWSRDAARGAIVVTILGQNGALLMPTLKKRLEEAKIFQEKRFVVATGTGT